MKEKVKKFDLIQFLATQTCAIWGIPGYPFTHRPSIYLQYISEAVNVGFL
jgi:hypothetical protein